MGRGPLAKLRVCMSCKWIYKGNACACPKCNWPSYAAHYVYGKKAYRYAVSQKPWFNRKMNDYGYKLQQEIREAREAADLMRAHASVLSLN